MFLSISHVSLYFSCLSPYFSWLSLFLMSLSLFLVCLCLLFFCLYNKFVSVCLCFCLIVSFFLEGDTRGGFTIFYPDDGLDTGNVLLTRSVYLVKISYFSLLQVISFKLELHSY